MHNRDWVIASVVLVSRPIASSAGIFAWNVWRDTLCDRRYKVLGGTSCILIRASSLRHGRVDEKGDADFVQTTSVDDYHVAIILVLLR